MKNYKVQTAHNYQHWEVRNGIKNRGNYSDDSLSILTTLPELQKQHPGVFGTTWEPDADIRALNIVLDEMNKHEPNSTPSFKAGQEVEFSDDKETWRRGLFHGKRIDENSPWQYIVEVIGGGVSIYKYIRPIPAQPTVESELGKLLIDLAIIHKREPEDMYVRIGIDTITKLFNRHQKHSGRVEVSVPTKEEIVKYWKELPEGSDAVIDTVLHFMTRKEQQG